PVLRRRCLLDKEPMCLFFWTRHTAMPPRDIWMLAHRPRSSAMFYGGLYARPGSMVWDGSSLARLSVASTMRSSSSFACCSSGLALLWGTSFASLLSSLEVIGGQWNSISLSETLIVHLGVS